jgi:hypothetical protein
MSSRRNDASNSRPACEPDVRFSVRAAAEPGVMPRILEPFAKRGVVPTEWHAHVRRDRLIVEIRVAGMDRCVADYIGRCLAQIYLVDRVSVSESHIADAA